MNTGLFLAVRFKSQHHYPSLNTHYDDVIMTMLASQITSLPVVCSIVYSDVNQGKHQSSASLAFVREIHRGPVNFPHKWPVTRKMFPFDDVIMWWYNKGTDYLTPYRLYSSKVGSLDKVRRIVFASGHDLHCTASHYMNHCWFIPNCTLICKKRPLINFESKYTIIVNAFEDDVCKIGVTLSRPPYHHIISIWLSIRWLYGTHTGYK